jgi:hypothetical protein
MTMEISMSISLIARMQFLIFMPHLMPLIATISFVKIHWPWKRNGSHKCYFCLTTTLVGMSVIDTFLLAKYHDIIKGCNNNKSSGMSVQQFAGVLAFQLIRKAGDLANKKIAIKMKMIMIHHHQQKL